MLRRCEREYQRSEQDRLSTLYTGNHSRDLWQDIGQFGLDNERRSKSVIPMEVVVVLLATNIPMF